MIMVNHKLIEKCFKNKNNVKINIHTYVYTYAHAANHTLIMTHPVSNSDICIKLLCQKFDTLKFVTFHGIM